MGEVTMVRQLKHFNVSRPHPAGGMAFAVAGYGARPKSCRGGAVGAGSANQFPRRPDATVISETIPLFYIAQNKNGFWLAREASARNGGLFLFRRSALRFAGEESEPSSCATMVLTEPFELDVPNQGSRLAASFDTAIDGLARHAPVLAAFIRMATAEWRKLIAEISRALASERRHREAIEQELFRGQYTLSSKNDDDLPVVR
jgi:hypothetical protein